MQNPELEITSVVTSLTATSSPDIQQATLKRYFTHDAGFRHPLCSVDPGAGSREKILGIYQWYRVMSPKIQLDVKTVTYNPQESIVILDIVQVFHIFLSPFKPAPSRLMVRISLKEENGLHYISMQEDFYHPDDFVALLVPPLIPLVHIILVIAGIISAFEAKIAQVLGFWRPGASSTGMGDSGHESEGEQLKWE